jgi:hypothetical protein
MGNISKCGQVGQIQKIVICLVIQELGDRPVRTVRPGDIEAVRNRMKADQALVAKHEGEKAPWHGVDIVGCFSGRPTIFATSFQSRVR